MLVYNFFQWLLFFYIYCFIGWCIESTIVSVENKKFVNRGFLRGPFLPIYGFGAIFVLLSCLPLKANPVLVYLCGMLVTSILEYITGWGMEKILKMRYWDYSDIKYNIHGRICLRCSLFWGFLSIFVTYVLHKPIEKVMLSMSTPVLFFIIGFLTCFILSDLVYAIKTAIDINKLIAKIADAKEEVGRIKAELETKILSNQRINQLNQRIENLRHERAQDGKKIGFIKRDYLKAHPTSRFSNSKFNEAYKELKQKIAGRKKK